ncbi:MAG: outer membrane protein assembly factor BamD [Bacteroidales bacterium]|nr:outer membrane protein assembly factor BamD [Bacteroidales bacterium]MDY6001559.1 outer membrane protein assembly factor BamD [Candidatus Cryptobacteroides sp.]
MSKSFKIFIAAAVMIAALTSCKSQFEALLNGSDVDAKYAAAFNYFNKGKYQKAAQLFESLSVLTNGTARDDTVQYYWGLSNYRYKDYYTAETNLSNFLTNFPNSPFAQDAAFLRIDCLYRSTYRYELDQNPTRNAIAVINQYLIDNPDSPHMTICENMLKNLNERLDKKAYENAKLYYNMEYYKAAWTAFKNILKDDADNIYREDILYYLAKSSYKYASMSVESKQKDRYLTFVDDYYNFIGEYPDSRNRKELSHYYDRAQKALGRYSGTEADLEVKEKDFSRDNEKNETIR